MIMRSEAETIELLSRFRPSFLDDMGCTMLDAVSTHAVFAANEKINSVSTLEFKTLFLEASRAGKFDAIGRVDKLGRSIAFLSAELRNDKGQVTATMTTIAKVRLSDAG
jgi:acyl-coenzyme A thioesterase PaaI-like protein